MTSSPEIVRGHEHLAAVDPVLRAIIREADRPYEPRRRLEVPPTDHFTALFICILGQRQPERATLTRLAAVRSRFSALSPGPRATLALSEAELLALVGNQNKAHYVRGLATRVVAGTLDLDALAREPDDAVAEGLISIPGLGPWSVEQFLFWHLERPDVLVTGDPAVRHAFVRAYGLSSYDLSAAKAMAEKWRPHRSLASHLLLRSRFGPGISERWPTFGRPLRHASGVR